MYQMTSPSLLENDENHGFAVLLHSVCIHDAESTNIPNSPEMTSYQDNFFNLEESINMFISKAWIQIISQNSIECDMFLLSNEAIVRYPKYKLKPCGLDNHTQEMYINITYRFKKGFDSTRGYIELSLTSCHIIPLFSFEKLWIELLQTFPFLKSYHENWKKTIHTLARIDFLPVTPSPSRFFIAKKSVIPFSSSRERAIVKNSLGCDTTESCNNIIMNVENLKHKFHGSLKFAFDSLMIKNQSEKRFVDRDSSTNAYSSSISYSQSIFWTDKNENSSPWCLKEADMLSNITNFFITKETKPFFNTADDAGKNVESIVQNTVALDSLVRVHRDEKCTIPKKKYMPKLKTPLIYERSIKEAAVHPLIKVSEEILHKDLQILDVIEPKYQNSETQSSAFMSESLFQEDSTAADILKMLVNNHLPGQALPNHSINSSFEGYEEDVLIELKAKINRELLQLDKILFWMGLIAVILVMALVWALLQIFRSERVKNRKIPKENVSRYQRNRLYQERNDTIVPDKKSPEKIETQVYMSRGWQAIEPMDQFQNSLTAFTGQSPHSERVLPEYDVEAFRKFQLQKTFRSHQPNSLQKIEPQIIDENCTADVNEKGVNFIQDYLNYGSNHSYEDEDIAIQNLKDSYQTIKYSSSTSMLQKAATSCNLTRKNMTTSAATGDPFNGIEEKQIIQSLDVKRATQVTDSQCNSYNKNSQDVNGNRATESPFKKPLFEQKKLICETPTTEISSKIPIDSSENNNGTESNCSFADMIRLQKRRVLDSSTQSSLSKTNVDPSTPSSLPKTNLNPSIPSSLSKTKVTALGKPKKYHTTTGAKSFEDNLKMQKQRVLNKAST